MTPDMPPVSPAAPSAAPVAASLFDELLKILPRDRVITDADELCGRERELLALLAERTSRLVLSDLAGKTLKLGLELLGVTVVDRM